MGSATTNETLTTILFDIDGTLLISQRAGGRAIDTVFERVFGRPRSIELRLHGRTDRGILTELFAAEGRDLTDSEFVQFIDSYLHELDQNLHQQPATVLPGVTELLPWLAEQPKVALGLLTGNVRQGAQTKLQHTGLNHYFAFGGFGDDHASRDDVAREAAASAQTHLQHRYCPASVIVIGDTIHDVTCGKAIGAKTLAVLTGGASEAELTAAQPDWICPDLRAGFSILQHLLR
ncbi:MAG: HAD family hydrolase [Pirellulaceae bacterium]|nr:HAD family hydrolase [Pirellulaceae bacterium]